MIRTGSFFAMLVVLLFAISVVPVRAQCVDSETQKITASDGEAGDLFGLSVSVAGDVLVAGAMHDTTRGPEAGAAYVFQNEGGAWIERATVIGSDTGPYHRFGSSVASDGSVLLIGASRYRSNTGAAYVFRDGPAGWSEEQRLLASDGTFGRFFGAATSVSGDRAAVTSWLGGGGNSGTGAAYMFRYNGSVWSEQQKLVPSDAQVGDLFGSDVSLDGSVVVVGAPGEPGFSSGAAYVFRTDGLTWAQEQKLEASDAELDDYFGRYVAVSGDTIVVGASGDDDLGSSAGAAYVFRFDGTTWIEEQKLLANDGRRQDSFGTGVAIDGERIVVGAYLENGDEMFEGAAYAFRQVDGVWSQEQRFVASDAVELSALGADVSVSGTTIVASSLDSELGFEAGATYVFEAVERRCGAGTVNRGASDFSSDLLFLNGSAGSCATRVVSAAVGDPIELTIQAPPSGPSPARFVLYAWLDGYESWNETPQPFSLGTTCFPTFLSVGVPKPDFIWNNVGREARLGPPNFPSQPAPSTIVSHSEGAPRAITLTLQGLIEDAASSASVPASVTNAIVLEVSD